MTRQRPPRWWLFWGSLGVIVYSYAIFPLLLTLRGLLGRRAVQQGADTPLVSVIIAAYNEAAIIVEKVENTLALDYPRDRLEIIVASDGSDDATNELVARFEAPVRLLALPRQGKNRTLNAAVEQARGAVLVFSDADSLLAPDALRHLLAPFADPEVGGVGGEHRYATDMFSGSSERGFWKIKRGLRVLQSQAGSMTTAEGQLYAIRRELFQPVPVDVTDDFFISIQVPAAHRRLVFVPEAAAYEKVGTAPQAAFARKVRITTRWFSTVWRMRRLLNPFRYGFYAMQLISLKVLRRLTFVPVIVLSVTAVLLWRRSWLYKLAALGQLGFHGAALLAYLARGKRLARLKPVKAAFRFDMSNVAALVALSNVIRGKRQSNWVPQRAAVTPPDGQGAPEQLIDVGA